MDHVVVSFHSQASPTLSTFLFSNTKNRRFRRKVTKAPALAKASMKATRDIRDATTILGPWGSIRKY